MTVNNRIAHRIKGFALSLFTWIFYCFGEARRWWTDGLWDVQGREDRPVFSNSLLPFSLIFGELAHLGAGIRSASGLSAL